MRVETPTQQLRKVWRAMIRRCTNPLDKSFVHYGGRGIAVCPQWMVFDHFLSDMGLPQPRLTLERVDVNGPYAPENCVWATFKQQSRNSRHNRRISFNGETLCLVDWAARYGCSESFLRQRLSRGMPFGEAISLPKRHLGKNLSRRGTPDPLGWEVPPAQVDSWKPVCRLSDGATFPSIAEAARASSTFSTAICRAIKRNGLSAGSRWQYVGPAERS